MRASREGPIYTVAGNVIFAISSDRLGVRFGQAWIGQKQGSTAACFMLCKEFVFALSDTPPIISCVVPLMLHSDRKF